MPPTATSRLFLRLLLPACLVACSTWRPASVAPQELFRDRAPERVRVTRTDNTMLTLTHPSLSGDGLVGSQGRTSITVPLADVTRLEVRAPDNTSTLLLLGVVVGLTVGFVVIARGAAGGPGS